MFVNMVFETCTIIGTNIKIPVTFYRDGDPGNAVITGLFRALGIPVP